MKISVHALSAEVFSGTLRNLAAILEKGAAYAAAKNFDPNVLAASRLAPDMLPLTKQIQIACDMAKNSVARLAGQEAPRFDDNEKTIEELRARVARTLEYLHSVPAAALDNSEDRDIRIPTRDATLEFKGLPFLQRWALPNFFFHVTTAYNILRHNGVDIGKKDYLGSI
jgi:hypothetical protein